MPKALEVVDVTQGRHYSTDGAGVAARQSTNAIGQRARAHTNVAEILDGDGATAWSVRIALDPKRVAGRIGRGQRAAVVEINDLVCTVRPEVDHTAGAIGAVVDVDA